MLRNYCSLVLNHTNHTKLSKHSRNGFDSDSPMPENSNQKLLLSFEFAIGIMPIIPYIGVVFPLIRLLLLDCYILLS